MENKKHLVLYMMNGGKLEFWGDSAEKMYSRLYHLSAGRIFTLPLYFNDVYPNDECEKICINIGNITYFTYYSD